MTKEEIKLYAMDRMYSSKRDILSRFFRKKSIANNNKIQREANRESAKKRVENDGLLDKLTGGKSLPKSDKSTDQLLNELTGSNKPQKLTKEGVKNFTPKSKSDEMLKKIAKDSLRDQKDAKKLAARIKAKRDRNLEGKVNHLRNLARAEQASKSIANSASKGGSRTMTKAEWEESKARAERASAERKRLGREKQDKANAERDKADRARTSQANSSNSSNSGNFNKDIERVDKKLAEGEAKIKAIDAANKKAEPIRKNRLAVAGAAGGGALVGAGLGYGINHLTGSKLRNKIYYLRKKQNKSYEEKALLSKLERKQKMRSTGSTIAGALAGGVTGGLVGNRYIKK